ncbi:MAG: hypothetical protein IJD36_01080 [Clostridia bacterium]|nr:hypothetical protein [Clostridia bacterium]
MKFATENEAKRWLRGFPYLKKELSMKADFYQDLIRDNKKMGNLGEKYILYYAAQIVKLQNQMVRMDRQMDNIMEILEPDERMIFTARYMQNIIWDVIGLHIPFSRRQAIRLHNNAIEKLVGFEIGGDADEV